MQKSKDKWLVVGDNNTSFFHASVKASRQRNQLTKFIDENGSETSEIPQMGKIATDYFESLFTSTGSGDLRAFFSGLPTKVTETMNQRLTREVSEEEIKKRGVWD